MIKECSQLETELNKLSQLMKATVVNQNWFIQFNELWSGIIGSSLFDKVLSLFLMAEKNHAERFWSEMYEESNYEVKKRKLFHCIEPLCVGMKKLSPQLSGHLTELSIKLTGKE